MLDRIIRGLLVVIMAFTSSLATAQSKPNADPEGEFLPVGVWHAHEMISHPDNRRPFKGHQTLSSGGREMLLELRNEQGKKLRARLERVNSSGDGTRMVVRQVDGDPLGLGEIAIVVGTSIVADFGPEEKELGQERRSYAECVLKVYGHNSGKAKTGKWSRLELQAPAQLSGKSERWYGETDMIAYHDWRTSQTEEVGVAQSKSRVADDIKSLAARGGWKGLSQTTINIDSDHHFEFTSSGTSGGKALLLIYSHAPQVRITYDARKKPSGYISHLDWGTNYPLLLNERGYDLTVRFSVSPEPGTLERPSGRFPVTIIVFGNAFGDYGPGVNYEQFGMVSPTQSDVLLRRTAKLAAAGFFEAMRRETIENDKQLGQAIATYGRNVALESLLEEVMPSVSDSERGYLNRFGQALLSNDVNYLSLSREACREQILQQIKRDHPDLGSTPEWIDFLVDLHLQRDTWRQSLQQELNK